jgi:glycosyltransferase involved in cell wall biosynthesis
VNVVLVSDHELSGGAAQSACRLAAALCPTQRVSRIVLFPEGQTHPWHTVSLIHEESSWRRQFYRVPRRLWPSRFPRPGTRADAGAQLARALRRLRPDLINLHNLHGAAPWGWGPSLAAVAARFAPVVWTLHDMWSFTGRCAYSYDCELFRSGCTSACPTAHEPPQLAPAEIAPAWRERQSLFETTPALTAIAPSRWLAQEARRGLWAGHRIEVIPYGVPTHIYRPLPRAAARRALGIPQDGLVLLLAAVDFTERRKGAAALPHLAPYLAELPLTLLTMGRGILPALPSSLRVHPLDWVDDEQTRSLAYNAADALLHPAPVDNFPNVVLEALASGTPSIALPIGGLPEIVRPGISGWLAAAPTSESLATVVVQALRELQAGCDLRVSCRRLAEDEYPLALQAHRYRQLFDELRNQSGRRTIR